MTTHLLDADVLIALTITEHEHHERASQWASTISGFAVCPIVEGALVRFLVRIGESAGVAKHVLQAVHAMSGCEFWPDSVSYSTAGLDHVHGHRQVTDAYLVSLAASRPDALLATFNEGLAQARPTGTLLVPPVR